jgi:hypothetical protein
MQQLHLQLYGKTKTKDFDEQLSTFRMVTLGPEPQAVLIPLGSPRGEKLVQVRIDPDDKPSSFVLHHLGIRSSDGTELYKWDGRAASLKPLVDLVATSTADGIVLESTSHDPFFLIPLARPESESLTVELSVSQRLPSAPGHQELAEAVRMLQSGLRFSLDELADQQEGFQDALTVHQAHSRGETAALQELMRRVSSDAECSREQIFSEVREDWRSIRRQVMEIADASARRQKQEANSAAELKGEIALISRIIYRIGGSLDVVKAVRTELGVCRDEDITGALRKLRAEAEENRRKLEGLETSLSWRLTKPFRSVAALLKGPHKP